ncbi:MAG: NADH-quinone oxidoreductase subunit C [Chloroflexi bacterium]|nr:NADH-quinone oxidoreductase subunit C [Chloroflexota bacterium]MBI4197893.1 NADH-quinone oxidoreductase subunit C [Chloroflexota bacterium]
MIRELPGEELARHVQVACPGAVERWEGLCLWVKPERVLEVCQTLKETPGMGFNLLNAISAVDYVEYFEVVYHLTSTAHLHSAVLKAKVYGREEPSLPSVVGLWLGADFQEREVWDLMGVKFLGHPNLKRILLWEGYPGHPLRRDYLEAPR